jgi:hypothetical protein
VTGRDFLWAVGGVGCRVSCRQLHLYSNQLTDSIPSTLGSLSTLT